MPIVMFVAYSHAASKPAPTAASLKALYDSSSTPHVLTIDTSPNAPPQFYDCQFVGQDLFQPKLYFIDTEFTSPSRGLTHVVHLTPGDDIEFSLKNGGVFRNGRMNIDGMVATKGPSGYCNDGTSVLEMFDNSKAGLSADSKAYVLSTICNNGITTARYFKKYQQDYVLMRATQSAGSGPDIYGYCRMSPNVPKLFADAGPASREPSTRPPASGRIVECRMTLRSTKLGVPTITGFLGVGRTEAQAIERGVEDCVKDFFGGSECTPDKLTVDECREGGFPVPRPLPGR